MHNAVVMEQVAKMAFISRQVNPQLTMNSWLIEKHFSRTWNFNAYYGQISNNEYQQQNKQYEFSTNRKYGLSPGHSYYGGMRW